MRRRRGRCCCCRLGGRAPGPGRTQTGPAGRETGGAAALPPPPPPHQCRWAGPPAPGSGGTRRCRTRPRWRPGQPRPGPARAGHPPAAPGAAWREGCRTGAASSAQWAATRHLAAPTGRRRPAPLPPPRRPRRPSRRHWPTSTRDRPTRETIPPSSSPWLRRRPGRCRWCRNPVWDPERKERGEFGGRGRTRSREVNALHPPPPSQLLTSTSHCSPPAVQVRARAATTAVASSMAWPGIVASERGERRDIRMSKLEKKMQPLLRSHSSVARPPRTPIPTHMPTPSTLHQLRVAQAELASLPADRVRWVARWRGGCR